MITHLPIDSHHLLVHRKPRSYSEFGRAAMGGPARPATRVGHIPGRKSSAIATWLTTEQPPTGGPATGLWQRFAPLLAITYD